jgi:hypothetical protein
VPDIHDEDLVLLFIDLEKHAPFPHEPRSKYRPAELVAACPADAGYRSVVP